MRELVGRLSRELAGPGRTQQLLSLPSQPHPGSTPEWGRARET